MFSACRRVAGAAVASTVVAQWACTEAGPRDNQTLLQTATSGGANVAKCFELPGKSWLTGGRVGEKVLNSVSTRDTTLVGSITGELTPASVVDWDNVTRPIIVGIAGPSGSGKSSVALGIRKRLRSAGVRCEVVSADSYYMSPPKGKDPATHNFDEPAALDLGLLASHLRMLKKGHGVEVPQYDFSTHSRLEQTTRVEPVDVLIVDGIFTLCVVELRDAFDMKLFVNADPDTCLSRRLRRDIVERGRDVDSVLAQYERFVKPARARFIQPSAAEADMILPHGRASYVAIAALSHELQRAAVGWTKEMVPYDPDNL